MTNAPTRRGSRGGALYGLGLLVVFGAAGCQVDIGGQVHPSPYWHSDDVQYFPPGPEFKLSREAAAMAAARQEELPPAEAAPMGPAGEVQ